MKWVTYILISVFVSSIFFTAVPSLNAQTKQVITFECTSCDSDQSLQQSATIIEERLNNFGLEDYTVNLFKQHSEMYIQISGEFKKENIVPLVISKGQLAFYESSELDEEGFTLYDYQNNSYSLSSVPYLFNSYVSKAHIKTEKKQNSLYIEFDKHGAELWQKITKKNVGKQLAIVIDGNVYSAPKVMAEIRGGKCMITGNFNPTDIKILASLISSAPLSSSFKLITE